MTTWSKADATTQWWDDDWTWAIIKPNVGVVHTTEGISWPTYADDVTGKQGAKAPHITGKPDFANKVIRWRQHFANEHSSRALQNAVGGVETNRNNALQVELIGTCDDRLATQWVVGGKTLRANVDYVYWPAAPDWAYQAVAELFAYWSKTYPALPLTCTVPFTKYPNGADVRLTGTQFQVYYGYLGHQHVPENAHDDPGLFPIQKVLTMAKAINAGGTPVATPTNVTITSNYSSVAQGVAITLTAAVTPAVEGTFKFLYASDGGKWVQIGGLVTSTTGNASIGNLPGRDTDFGVVFYPKDTTKYQADQAYNCHVHVVDVGALEARVAKLEGGV